MSRPPPRSTPTSPLFPYTPLFRPVLTVMILDEGCVGQRPLKVMAHRLASGRAGVGGERLMAVRRKLLQGVSHRAWHSVLGKNLRENARAPGRFPPERCGAR